MGKVDVEDHRIATVIIQKNIWPITFIIVWKGWGATLQTPLGLILITGKRNICVQSLFSVIQPILNFWKTFDNLPQRLLWKRLLLLVLPHGRTKHNWWNIKNLLKKKELQLSFMILLVLVYCYVYQDTVILQTVQAVHAIHDYNR